MFQNSMDDFWCGVQHPNLVHREGEGYVGEASYCGTARS